MFKAIGRKAAKGEYADVIRYLSRNSHQLLEFRCRLALYLRTTAKGQLLPIDVEGCTPSSTKDFLSQIESTLGTTDALAASTKAQKNRRSVEQLVGPTPNSMANAVLSGYFQMLGQVKPDRRRALSSSSQASSKDENLLCEFRELIVKTFDGCEDFLLTNKVELAAARQGMN